MGPAFWLLVAVCYLGIILLGVVNVGGYLLRYRARHNPPRAQLVRGTMILAVFLVLPRFLPHGWLWGVLLVALLVWEVATWFMRADNRAENARTVPIIDDRSS